MNTTRNRNYWILHCITLLLMLFGLTTVWAENSTRITYFHNDAQGSVFAATDELGNLKWQRTYRPYGAEQPLVQGTEEPLGYAGKLKDDSGLVYFGARYYDPTLGRFMSMDPVGVLADNPYSFNRYVYANANPYKYTDPDGRSPELLYATDPLAYYEGIAGPRFGVDANTREGNRVISSQLQREAAIEIIGAGAGYGLGKVLGVLANTVKSGSASAARVGEVFKRYAEANLTGSGKHGINWTEGPARAINTGKPQGQFGSQADVDWVVQQSHRVAPSGRGTVIPLPAGHSSIVHLPEGGTRAATEVYIKVYKSGKVHAYPK